MTNLIELEKDIQAAMNGCLNSDQIIDLIFNHWNLFTTGKAPVELHEVFERAQRRAHILATMRGQFEKKSVDHEGCITLTNGELNYVWHPLGGVVHTYW